MTLQEAKNTLDSVIPTPGNRILVGQRPCIYLLPDCFNLPRPPFHDGVVGILCGFQFRERSLDFLPCCRYMDS